MLKYLYMHNFYMNNEHKNNINKYNYKKWLLHYYTTFASLSEIESIYLNYIAENKLLS